MRLHQKHYPQHFINLYNNTAFNTLKCINWEMSGLRIVRPCKASNWEMSGPENQRTENCPTMQISLNEKCPDWEMSVFHGSRDTDWTRNLVTISLTLYYHLDLEVTLVKYALCTSSQGTLHLCQVISKCHQPFKSYTANT